MGPRPPRAEPAAAQRRPAARPDGRHRPADGHHPPSRLRHPPGASAGRPRAGRRRHGRVPVGGGAGPAQPDRGRRHRHRQDHHPALPDQRDPPNRAPPHHRGLARDRARALHRPAPGSRDDRGPGGQHRGRRGVQPGRRGAGRTAHGPRPSHRRRGPGRRGPAHAPGHEPGQRRLDVLDPRRLVQGRVQPAGHVRGHDQGTPRSGRDQPAGGQRRRPHRPPGLDRRHATGHQRPRDHRHRRLRPGRLQRDLEARPGWPRRAERATPARRPSIGSAPPGSTPPFFGLPRSGADEHRHDGRARRDGRCRCLPDLRRTVRPPGVRRRSHRSCRALGGQPRPRSGRRSRRRRRRCPRADRMAGRSSVGGGRGCRRSPPPRRSEQPRGIHRPHRGHRRVDRDGARLHRRRLGPGGGDPGHGHRGASGHPPRGRHPGPPARTPEPVRRAWPPSGTTCPTRPPTSSSPH